MSLTLQIIKRVYLGVSETRFQEIHSNSNHVRDAMNLPIEISVGTKTEQ